MQVRFVAIVDTHRDDAALALVQGPMDLGLDPLGLD
jgi:hypothetical protein